MPPKTNEGAKPQILLISGPDRNKFSTAVPQRGRKAKIENLKKWCQSLTTVVHCDTNLVGVGTNNGDRRASLHVGWEDFATFGKYGDISRKRHMI